MLDERSRVIRHLLESLEEAGIEPESEWFAEFIPGRGWSFHSGDGSASSSSSSAGTGVTDEAIRPKAR